jgi:murein L,D-transpeptidase YcbB/YkuD
VSDLLRLGRFLAVAALLGLGQPVAADGLGVTAFGQAVAEALAPASGTTASGAEEALAAFYRERRFAPVWTGPEDAARRQALLSAMARAPEHGLPTRRYDAGDLVARFRAVSSERARGELEVETSRLFLRLARDLHAGVLVPGSVDANIRRAPPELDAAAVLARLESESPAAILRDLLPTAPEYNRLMRARMDLLRQIDAGGWGPQVPAARLAPGDSGAAVVALRDRLMAMGYLQRSAAADYDGVLQAAVQRFQLAHGIAPDGVAGPATLEAINTGPEARLPSVLVALERERWMNIPRGERHIWVNLTDFSTRIVDRDRITFETVSIVGDVRHETQTYEFSELMTYMEINPDWTIPREMVARSYLGALQANPNAYGHLQLVDGRGQVINRSAVNFAAYSARTLPFNLRQPPGPRNPLGKVKFMFPNPHAIYLHDTPDRHLFDREMRALSNGCIRLQDPEAFAHVLLARQVDDPEAHFDRIWRSGEQTRVYLDDPVPVHLVYRTAFTDARGNMNYRADVYRRDSMVFEALQRAGVELPGAGS